MAQSRFCLHTSGPKVGNIHILGALGNIFQEGLGPMQTNNCFQTSKSESGDGSLQDYEKQPPHHSDKPIPRSAATNIITIIIRITKNSSNN